MKGPKVSRKKKRIEDNRRRTAKRREGQFKVIRLDPCVLNLGSLETAPHKPGCLCIQMRLVQKLLDIIIPPGQVEAKLRELTRLK